MSDGKSGVGVQFLGKLIRNGYFWIVLVSTSVVQFLNAFTAILTHKKFRQCDGWCGPPISLLVSSIRRSF